jgi:hypothetical protein
MGLIIACFKFPLSLSALSLRVPHVDPKREIRPATPPNRRRAQPRRIDDRPALRAERLGNGVTERLPDGLKLSKPFCA